MAEKSDPSGDGTSRVEAAETLWSRPAGYRDVLQMAVPLVLSTSSWTIQSFVDRMFLFWYTPEAMAAALSAGFLSFTIISFFIGTASYANTFVAQYHGAGQPRRLGPSIWQAVYFSLVAGLLLPVFWPLARPIFQLVGHEPVVQDLEARYFRIMMFGAIFTIYTNAVSSLYTGLGKNWPIMWVNALVTAVNVALDYALIFGHWGFPEWGIEGAAWATILANGAGALVFTFLVFSSRNERAYATRSGRRFDRRLFGRMMFFGLPSGIQFMLDMVSWTLFVFIVGRIGTLELIATTVSFQINTLAFMPMIGFGIATSTLVGQWLGRDKPELASRATWSSFHLTFVYMATVAVLYVVVPWVFIEPFAAKADPAKIPEISQLATVILRFVAVYSIFDTLNVIFASALRGAGDTRFVMVGSVALAWVVMVIPTAALCGRGKGGIYLAWTFASAYVVLLGLGFLVRFLLGKWRTMRVIERPLRRGTALKLPEAPASEVEL